MYKPKGLAERSNKNMMTDNPYVTKCADCKDWVRKNVADYSNKYLGKSLCYSCQQERKAD